MIGAVRLGHETRGRAEWRCFSKLSPRRRECVVYWYSILIKFSNLYTAVDTPARGRVVSVLNSTPESF